MGMIFGAAFNHVEIGLLIGIGLFAISNKKK